MFVASRGSTSLLPVRTSKMALDANFSLDCCISSSKHDLINLEDFPALTKSKPISFNSWKNENYLPVDVLLGSQSSSTDCLSVSKKKRLKRKRKQHLYIEENTSGDASPNIKDLSRCFMLGDEVSDPDMEEMLISKLKLMGESRERKISDDKLHHIEKHLSLSSPLPETVNSFQIEDEGFGEESSEYTNVFPIYYSVKTVETTQSKLPTSIVITTTTTATSKTLTNNTEKILFHSHDNKTNLNSNHSSNYNSRFDCSLQEGGGGREEEDAEVEQDDEDPLLSCYHNHELCVESSQLEQNLNQNCVNNLDKFEENVDNTVDRNDEQCVSNEIKINLDLYSRSLSSSHYNSSKKNHDDDDDDMEGTDLLHLISNSLDRFNAILHPQNMISSVSSNLTSGLGESTNGLFDDEDNNSTHDNDNLSKNLILTTIDQPSSTTDGSINLIHSRLENGTKLIGPEHELTTTTSTANSHSIVSQFASFTQSNLNYSSADKLCESLAFAYNHCGELNELCTNNQLCSNRKDYLMSPYPISLPCIDNSNHFPLGTTSVLTKIDMKTCPSMSYSQHSQQQPKSPLLPIFPTLTNTPHTTNNISMTNFSDTNLLNIDSMNNVFRLGKLMNPNELINGTCKSSSISMPNQLSSSTSLSTSTSTITTTTTSPTTLNESRQINLLNQRKSILSVCLPNNSPTNNNDCDWNSRCRQTTYNSQFPCDLFSNSNLFNQKNSELLLNDTNDTFSFLSTEHLLISTSLCSSSSTITTPSTVTVAATIPTTTHTTNTITNTHRNHNLRGQRFTRRMQQHIPDSMPNLSINAGNILFNETGHSIAINPRTCNSYRSVLMCNTQSNDRLKTNLPITCSNNGGYVLSNTNGTNYLLNHSIHNNVNSSPYVTSYSNHCLPSLNNTTSTSKHCETNKHLSSRRHNLVHNHTNYSLNTKSTQNLTNSRTITLPIPQPKSFSSSATTTNTSTLSKLSNLSQSSSSSSSLSKCSPNLNDTFLVNTDLNANFGQNKPVLAKWRRACSFYLRGHCKKEDCEFAHDLTKVTCKFWEMGECFKGSTCPFLHGYPPELTID